MKPAPFEFFRPASVSDALRRAASDQEAKYLAGGQSLIAMMNFRLARPSTVIDLGGLRELDRLFDEGPSLLIGSLTTHNTLEHNDLVRDSAPLLTKAARHIGHVAIRNQGTLGGTIAHADPAAELPGVLLALNATIFAEGHNRSRREIAAADLFDGLYSTTLDADELVTWVRVPKLEASVFSGFAETSPRHGDFAEAASAVLVELQDNKITRLRAVLIGVVDRPIVCFSASGLSLTISDPNTWYELWDEFLSDGALDGIEGQKLDLASVVFVRACQDAVAASALRRSADE